MRKWRYLPLLLIMSIISSYCVASLYKRHTDRSNLAISNLALLPEPLAKMLTLEFTGLVSDYLMLNTLTYLGEKLLSHEETKPEEWKIIHQALVQITNLDPMANDPYTLAETTLPWEAGMVKETNEILEKAAIAQPNNSRPYFFLWYNHYYFLNAPKKAAIFLEKAAQVPGAPQHYSTLAARMHLYSGQIMGGIIFLREIIKDTPEPSIQRFFKLRLEALEKIAYLEGILVEFRKKYGHSPQKLDDLVTGGLLMKIPRDPYGGTFYITPEGRVYTSSGLSFAGSRKNRADQKLKAQ